MPRKKKEVSKKLIYKVRLTGKNEIVILIMKDHDYDSALSKGRSIWKLLDSPVSISIYSDESMVFHEHFSHIKK